MKQLLKSAASGGRQRVSQESASLETLRGQWQRNPGNIRLRIKLADAMLAADLQQEAVTEYLGAARSYVEQGFAPMAIAIFKKIVKINADHIEANLALARIYQRENLFADAVTYYQSVFHHHYTTDRRQEAFDILEKIIEIAPDKEQFRRQMREMFPDFREVEKSAYSDLLVTNRTAGAEKLDITPADDDFFDLGAELSAELGEDDLATIPDRGTEHAPAALDADIGVERIFAALKQTIREGSASAGDDDADQQKFHYNLAVAYRELGMNDQAIEESQTSLDVPAYRIPALLLRGQIFRELGNFKESLSQLQQGLRERGLNRRDFLSLKYELGITLVGLNDAPRAVEAFREVYSIDPAFREVAAYIAELDEGVEMIS
ncbi:MAG: tetratricopeptide repeat protein [Deltaproteobacteria bacterium]|nr:tetratricopeptide repeat protein [Candidatus Anaeroferrophillacea bacterium]